MGGSAAAHGATRGRVIAAVVAMSATMVVGTPSASAATLDVCPSGCTYSSIQAAIDAATAGDEIAVGAGLYSETVSVTTDVDVVGSARTDVVVDAGGAGSTITVPAGVTASIEQVTITGGTALDGAGINNAGTLTLVGVAVRGNTATDASSVADGGGVATTGALTILDSVIEGNTADRGGGVWSAGAPVTMTRTLLADNVARSHGGGGVAAALSSSSLTLRDSVVDGNRVVAPGTDQRGGGGIWASQADVTLEDVEVTGNASGYSGGGVYVSGSAAVVAISRTTIDGNVTGTDRGVGGGGGLDANSSVDVTLIDSTVSRNDALGSGGGLRVRSTASVVAENSTISGNSSTGSGGGVLVEGGVTLDSVTIASNTGRFAGGVAGYRSTPTLRNTAIGDNTATDSDPQCGGTVFVDAGQVALVEDSTGCTFSGTGTVLAGTDPVLDVLADNGGPTETHLPGLGSPLIDAGATTLTTDQRALSRPVGTAPDLGAVEVQSTPTPSADLSVAIVPEVVDIAAGLSQDFDVTVFNSGPSDATSVLLTVAFSGEFVPEGLPSACVHDAANGRIVCDIGTVPDGSLETLRLPVLFPSGGEQTVLVEVEGEQPDPDGDNNTAFGVVRVLGGTGANVSAVLGINSGANTYGHVLAGTTLVVNLGASNSGPNPATDVVVETEVPDGWTIASLDSGCTIGFPDVDVITCALGDIPRPVDPRFPTTRLVQLGLVPDGPATLVATVSTTADDPEPADDTTSLEPDVRAVAADVEPRLFNASGGFVLGETTGVLPLTLVEDPDVDASASFDLSVTPSIGVIDVDVRGLGWSWSCAATSPTSLSCESPADLDALPEEAEVRLTVDDLGDTGDLGFRDYAVEITTSSDDVFELDPSNDTDIGFMTFTEPPPIEVRALEVTQAVQDWENSVALVADRATAVRVFVQDPASLGSSRVGGELRGYRNGVPLTPASITALSSAAVPDVADEWRDEKTFSLRYLLPASWTTEGPVELEYVLSNSENREPDCIEPDSTPDCRVQVEFEAPVVVPLDVLAVDYVTDEVQDVVLTDPIEPDDEEQKSASGTFTLTHDAGTADAETTAPIDVDASRDDVRAALEALDAFDTGEVAVRGLPGNRPDDERGWRVLLRTQQDLPMLTLDDSGVTDGSLRVDQGRHGGTYVSPSVGDVVEQLARIESALPVSDFDLQWHFPPQFDFKPVTYADVNPMLESHRTAQLIGCPRGCRPADLRVAGLMLGGGIAGSGGNNDGAVFSSYSGGVDGPTEAGYARNRAPHELAHSYGKSHAVRDVLADGGTIGICGATGSDNAELHPYFGSTGVQNGGIEVDDVPDDLWPLIGPPSFGDIGIDREVWGFDVRFASSGNSRFTIQDPDVVAAMMSYCAGGNQVRWPSSFGYERVLAEIRAGTVGFPEGDGTSGDRLIVTGTIDRDTGGVDLAPVVGTRGVRPGDAPAGDVVVAVVDGDGAVLDSATVEALGEGHGDRIPGQPAADDSLELFSAVLDRLPPEAAALVVRQGGTERTRITASPTAPTVALDAPAAGTTVGTDGLTIAWTADDADGDQLTASVHLGDGNGTWRPLALAVDGDRLQVPSWQLAASAGARVRVVVSDGLRTATATSAPFTIGDAPPIVEVTAPEVGATVTDEETLTLDAFAFDGDDGRLDGSTATWRSDLDGELGTGLPSLVPVESLEVGCHLVTVTVVDAGGTEATAATTVGIGEPCAPEASTGTVVVSQAAPADPTVAFPFRTDAGGATTFELTDGEDRTLVAPAGRVTVVQGIPDGWRTSVACDDPTSGTGTEGADARATVDLDPGERVVCTFTTTPDDQPPTVEVHPRSATVQVGDDVVPITFTVTDPDTAPDALEVSVQGLPDGLAAGEVTCDASDDGAVCEGVVTGTAAGPPGTSEMVATASDGTSSASAIATVVVAPEDALLRLAGRNPSPVAIGPDEDGATLELVVRTTEADPDLADGTPGVTDLAGGSVTVALEPVGPGSTVVAAACEDRLLGELDDQTLVTTCTFDDVGANTYAVVATAGGDLTGSARDVLVVYEPTDHSVRGTGEVAGPDDSTTRFWFTMSHTPSGIGAKGSLVVVRTLPDGSQHVLQGNAIDGLTFGGDSAASSWTSFVGKATYTPPDADPTGNHSFTVYAEDGQPDRFWIEVRDRDGHVVGALSLPAPAVEEALPLAAGAITIADRSVVPIRRLR